MCLFIPASRAVLVPSLPACRNAYCHFVEAEKHLNATSPFIRAWLVWYLAVFILHALILGYLSFPDQQPKTSLLAGALLANLRD